MRLRTAVRTTHRWLALALAVQMAVWAASGVALSFLPDNLTRADASALPDFVPDLEARSYASPGGIIAQMGRATDIELKRSMGRVVYVARGPEGAAVFDARTSQRLSPLDEEAARLIAAQDFAGAEPIQRAVRTVDAQGLSAWRIEFGDRNRTSVHVSAHTGDILQRTNRYSKLHALFRGLHVMDVSGRGAADNALVKIMGLTALGFVLSGVGQIALRWRDGRYRLRRRSARKAPEHAAGDAADIPI